MCKHCTESGPTGNRLFLISVITKQLWMTRHYSGNCCTVFLQDKNVIQIALLGLFHTSITYAKVIRWSQYRLNCHWQKVVLTQGKAASSSARSPRLPWTSAQAHSSRPNVLLPRESSLCSHTAAHQSILRPTLAVIISKLLCLYLCQDLLVFSTLITLFSQRLKFREIIPCLTLKDPGILCIIAQQHMTQKVLW